MAPLLPSLFLRVGTLSSGSKTPQHLRDRTPVAMAWKDEHSSKVKRLVVLLDDLADLEYDIANVASGEQFQSAPDYSPGPSDIAYLAVKGCINLIVGLVAVLLTPAPNPNSPTTKRPPISTAGPQLVLYDLLAKRRHSRTLSLRDCPNSVAPLEEVPQDIGLNCSGDLLLTCIEAEVKLFRISHEHAALPSGRGASWWGTSAKQAHRQLWPMQVISGDFLGARFCGMLPNRILGLSHPKPTAKAAGMRAVQIDLKEAPPAADTAVRVHYAHDVGLGELPGRVTAWRWDAQGAAVALGTADGVIALHLCATPESTKKSVAPEGRLVETLAWHPLGSVIIVGLEGGMLAMLDAALQPLLVVANVSGLGEGVKQPTAVVDMASALGLQGMRPGSHRRRVVPLTEWARPVMESFVQGSRTPLYEIAALAVPAAGFQDFAIGVCQVAVGGLSGGRLRVQELVAQHLSDGEPLRALNLVEAAGDPQAQYHGMQLLLDHMLRGDLAGEHSAAIMEVLDESLQVIRGQVGRLPLAKQGEVLQVLRRYCAKLLDMGWVEPAFKVASAVQCSKAMEDVYVVAVQKRDTVLAQAVWDGMQAVSATDSQHKLLPSPIHLQALEQLQVEVADYPGPEQALHDSPPKHMSSEEGAASGALLEVQGKVAEALTTYGEAGEAELREGLQALVDASEAPAADSVATAVATGASHGLEAAVAEEDEGGGDGDNNQQGDENSAYPESPDGM